MNSYSIHSRKTPRRTPWAILALLSGALLCVAPTAHAQSLISPSGAKGAASGFGNLVFCNGLEAAVGCQGITSADAAPVALELVSPLVSANRRLPIQFRAGWPLIFRAAVKFEDMLGIGRMYGEQIFELQQLQFAEVGQGAAIVFDNPDSQWSFGTPIQIYPRDETLLDFYPDQGDVTFANDDVVSGPLSHDPTIRFALRPEIGGPLPKAGFGDFGGGATQVAMPDGVQFGADDDFPGLVILSNVGVGIVLDTLANGWNPLLPRQARNLAGFTNAIGYELSDTLGRTSITSTMIVPRFLFSPIRLRDSCVGVVSYDFNNEPISCAGVATQRVDGGPLTPFSGHFDTDPAAVEIRAFVVAPIWNSVSNRLLSLDTVVDSNADGRVTALDAKLMGYQVLSNEIVFNFRQVGNQVLLGTAPFAPIHGCNPIPRPDDPGRLRQAGTDFQYDWDGNGFGRLLFPVVCPGGGSGVTRPPQ